MWIDQAVKWLLPREAHFHGLLERGAVCGLEGGTPLVTSRSEPMNPGRQALLKPMGPSRPRSRFGSPGVAKMGRGRVELPTPRFSVACSTN